MKNFRFTLGLATLITIGSLAFSSCKKDKKDDTPDSDTGSASDHSYVENLSNDIDNIGDQAGNTNTGSSLSTYKFSNPENSILSTCATVTSMRSDTSNADTLLVDFGTSNCVCNDGKTRNGKLQYVYSGGRHYRDSGIVITVTPISYSVEGNGVSGTKTITNKGRISGGNFVWDINSNLSIVKANNGGTITWSCSRSKVLLNTSTVYSGPSAPIDWAHARIGISGSASGTTASGTSYTALITNQMIRDFGGCSIGAQHRYPFIQGTFQFTPSGRATRTVDFGSGTCDLDATVTINGHTYNITL